MAIPSGIIGNTVPSLSSLQNIFQYKIVDSLTSVFGGESNQLYVLLLTYVVFSCINGLFNLLPDVFSNLKMNSWLIWYKISSFTMYCIRKIIKEKKLYDKDVEINYLNQQKSVNEMFKPVLWYIMRTDDIDLLLDSPLYFTLDDKIEKDSHLIENFKEGNFKINKSIVNNKWKKLKFKGCEIEYLLSSNIVTVYNTNADQKKEKENFQIRLHTIVDEFTKSDILDEFCKFCCTEYAKSLTSTKWEQQIYRNKNGKWEGTPSGNFRKIETVILKDGIKEDIQEDMKLFLSREDWYKKRGIPYSRGYLFYGTPGTGKTSMIHALSNYCQRHIHYLMLNEISNDSELFDLLKQIKYKETVLVIEDIDCMTDIIQQRTKKNDKVTEEQKMPTIVINTGMPCDRGMSCDKDDKKSGKLTLSGLLNALDGVFDKDKRILIMTTNHSEILDDALIRPGRIDRNFLFDNCDKDQVKKLYEMFFEKECNKTLIERIDDKKYSPATLVGLFLRHIDKPDKSFDELS
jgi:ATP-dependent 26S proteasome regulatory subunit